MPRTPTPWRSGGWVSGSFLALALLVLGACNKPPAVELGALHGTRLPAPLAKPRFVLTTTAGERYDFARETAGTLTFLFFGYTHCPDVCPVHMANLNAGLETLDYADRQRIKVVFVTADPARDTPDVLRSWLNNFNPAFIGLVGTQAEVDSAQRASNVSPAVFTPKRADGSYDVGHAGQIIVFGADDTARVVYPFGARQADWIHDLPLLLQGNDRLQPDKSSS